MGGIKISKSFLFVLTVLVSLYVKFQVDLTHFKLVWLYPYALLWTADRDANLQAWLKYAPVNKNIVYAPMPVPELTAAGFTFESLREATHNFRLPAVVRGLFNGTRAVERWADVDYMSAKLGSFLIPVVRNGVVGTMQDDRVLYTFEESYRAMVSKDYAKEYMFFPVKSRFTFNGSTEGNDEGLQNTVNQMCHDDLELSHRLWKGFSTKSHKNFIACQMIIGKSTVEMGSKSIGSDWHCAGGNNWFIQVAGAKYWEFVEPKYSPYMAPLKGGAFNMWTGNKNMAEIQKHIPRWAVTLRAGDMVYNPDWMWHKIVNLGGLSIGVPTREVNFTNLFQNNFYFSSIAITNKVLVAALGDKSGLALPGYPPPSISTEADN